MVNWRWVGTGSELWRTRVEIFVDGDSGRLEERAARATSGVLDCGAPDALGAGADQGIGLAEPVVGLIFSVAADSPGQAMQTAVDVATEALGSSGRGFFAASALPTSNIPDIAPAMPPNDPVASPTTGPFEPGRWRWTGTGGERWHTRVEACVDGDSAHLLASAARAVSEQLEHGDPADRGGRADQGTGIAAPVVGLTFMVAADDPGQAAQTAVDVAVRALGADSRGLYGVSVFRASAAPACPSEDYPPLMD